MEIDYYMDFIPVYSVDYYYNNYRYVAESRVSDDALVFLLYPHNSSPLYNYRGHESYIRYIDDGKVTWYEGDELDSIVQDVFLIANNIADQTNKLLLRSVKIKAFS